MRPLVLIHRLDHALTKQPRFPLLGDYREALASSSDAQNDMPFGIPKLRYSVDIGGYSALP
jgi:hypothetical protein